MASKCIRAAFKGYLDIAEMLLRRGANLTSSPPFRAGMNI